MGGHRHSSKWQECWQEREAGNSHLEPHAISKVEAEWVLNLVKSVLRKTTPPKLPKQDQQLWTKCSNVRDYGDISHSNYHCLPSNKARYKISVFKRQGGRWQRRKERVRGKGRKGRCRYVGGMCMKQNRTRWSVVFRKCSFLLIFPLYSLIALRQL